MRNRTTGGSANADLTAREEQILRLVAKGLSNKEVGRTLSLQEKTVKHYMTNILQKLQVRNRVEAAIKAGEMWGKAG
jgi:DNA-binding NarL/FixJ family response regulator